MLKEQVFGGMSAYRLKDLSTTQTNHMYEKERGGGTLLKYGMKWQKEVRMVMSE